MSLKVFAAADGIKFWRRGPFAIFTGWYSNGKGAVAVRNLSDGQVEDKISVNMSGVYNGPFATDEFAVKWVGDEGALANPFIQHVFMLGLFEDTGRRLAGPYSENYAVVWRFARCNEPEHEGTGDHRVMCIDCRIRWKKNFEDSRDRADAREAIGRLNTFGEGK